MMEQLQISFNNYNRLVLVADKWTDELTFRWHAAIILHIN